MPTPRHPSEISKQVRRNLLGDRGGDPNAWILGTVTGMIGEINPIYEVTLLVSGAFGAVRAVSVLDAPLALGSKVWVVQRAPYQYLIVGEV